ncbi:uncharacterized protein B0P05DRAFT_562769 [Gilbertella persicaria]|uniref:uncharacterized protein n=1 Tax=Gilbertella persicaria TaxID=101096 RepID=UPI00221F8D84|nr:uncharacterized protein B0P05DRAFT_562769 [Gilbertella persicaria]KAI8051057.1 hypothetical protein B0P05DRAFT_562769 [Gilbertella persicaria]
MLKKKVTFESVNTIKAEPLLVNNNQIKQEVNDKPEWHQESVAIPRDDVQLIANTRKRMPHKTKAAKQTCLTDGLPRSKSIMTQYRKLLDLHGCNRDMLFRRLIYQDYKNKPEERIYRWNFAFRFCVWFVVKKHTKIKPWILASKDKIEKWISFEELQGLSQFLTDHAISFQLLQGPLADEAVGLFLKKSNRLAIKSFLYTMCAFLYTFLPIQHYHSRFHPDQFSIIA